MAFGKKTVYKLLCNIYHREDKQTDNLTLFIRIWTYVFHERDDKFELILEDEMLLSSFTEFLTSQFSTENLSFYEDVHKFRRLKEKSEIKQRAVEICDTYLGHNGNELVLNVDVATQNNILLALNAPTITMFDIAFLDVEQILKTSYIGFIGGTPSIGRPKPTGIFSCMDSEQ